MKKQVTLGQLIASALVVLSALATFVLNSYGNDIDHNARIATLEDTTKDLLIEQKETNKLLYSIDGTLKAKKGN